MAGRTLEEITPAELERFRSERLVKIKPATINREFALLRRVFKVAIRDGKSERNPGTKLGMLREPSGRVRYLSDDEEKELMQALVTDHERQRVTVLLQTGLRKSEFLGLRYAHLSPGHRHTAIERLATRKVEPEKAQASGAE